MTRPSFYHAFLHLVEDQLMTSIFLIHFSAPFYEFDFEGVIKRPAPESDWPIEAHIIDIYGDTIIFTLTSLNMAFFERAKSAVCCGFSFQRDAVFQPFLVYPALQLDVESRVDDLHVILVAIPAEVLVRVAEGVLEMLLKLFSPEIGDEVILVSLGRFQGTGDVDPVGLVE